MGNSTQRRVRKAARRRGGQIATDAAGIDNNAAVPLWQSRERYRIVTENIDDAVVITSGWKRLYVNRAFLDMFGYRSTEEALAEEAFSRTHPDDFERVTGYAKALQNDKPALSRCEFRAIRKDGVVIHVETTTRKALTKEGDLWLACLRNITERKRMEEALRESEEKFRILFENSTYPVLLLDGDKFVDCNETALRFTGCSSKDLLIGRSPWDLSPERQPDGRLSIEKAKELIAETLKNGNNHFEWVRLMLSGEEVWVEVSLTVIPIRGKQIIYSEWRDITLRKQTEASLRESEERYRIAIENSNDAVVIVQGDRHAYVNQKFLDLFGYRMDEVLGRDHSLVVHPDDLAMVQARNRRRQGGEHAPGRYDFKGIKKDGSRVFAEVSAALITYKGKPASLAFIRDATERKALEAQLRHAQKMEAIGTLAAGVAHDFNNILMALMGYANLMQVKMDPNDPVRAYADQIIACTGKAAALTQSLLTFGRKQVMELKPHRVDTIVRNVETLLRRLLPEDVRLTLDLTGDLTVIADAGQIGQVLLNLATNARDAMPDGGELRIETRLAQIDARFIAEQGYGKAGPYALLSVSDTGTGMDRNTQDKIFEPFYTTKEVGKGTGLGLAIVYGIVKQHQGYIIVTSEPGMGATFDIYLPRVAQKISEQIAPAGQATGGAETILITDDDPDVRKVAAEIMQAAGYNVMEAANGGDAIQTFSAQPGAIDLLLLDVVMPGIRGSDAYEEMRAVRPAVKVLFMTGYPQEVLPDRRMRKKALISKPFSPNELLEKVRNILDA
jgi:PAS domain S-box-containing protein